MLKPLPPDPAVTKIGNSSKRRRAVAYTVEDLLSVLHPHCPVKIDALWTNRRRVEHGLTTVGLKIHCLGDNRELLNLIEALGGRSEGRTLRRRSQKDRITWARMTQLANDWLPEPIILH